MMAEFKIAPGEKFAMVVLPTAAVEDDLPSTIQLSDNLWAATSWPLELDEHWKEWLGSIEMGRVEAPSLLLLTKAESETPGVLDRENQELEILVSYLREGLLVSDWFWEWDRDSILNGANHARYGFQVRQYRWFEEVQRVIAGPFRRIDAARLERAAELVTGMLLTRGRGKYVRIKHAWRAFGHAMVATSIEDRLHQLVRCVEGFILPKVGNSRSQFKSRTELFVGPREHEVVDEIYKIRSAVEHLHVARFVLNREHEREAAIAVFKRALQVEAIARHCLGRLFESEDVRSHFINDDRIAEFWSLDDEDKRSVWGDSLDLRAAITEFDASRLDDRELGLQ